MTTLTSRELLERAMNRAGVPHSYTREKIEEMYRLAVWDCAGDLATRLHAVLELMAPRGYIYLAGHLVCFHE